MKDISFSADAAVTLRNVESKAKIRNLDRLRRIAHEIGADFQGIEQQRDTYFHVQRGRLKLREIAGKTSTLIAYDRDDTQGARTSHYRLVEVSQPEALRLALDSTLGISCVVEKRREIFLYRNVRIHLDDLENIGTFLELEAVLEPGCSEADGHSILDDLRQRFDIDDDDLIGVSYCDMLAQKTCGSISRAGEETR